MSELTEHYRLLLGLDTAWCVEGVDLSFQERKIEIRVSHLGGKLACPECGAACGRADLAPERAWRHLDTMQFQTVVVGQVPRANCTRCGVKTITVPWASKHSRFTLLFEAFVIHALQACSTVQAAAGLLQLDWHSVESIMKRAVGRGMARRNSDEVTRVGIDEKSFLKGQSYVSVMTDLDQSRVLEVVPDRTEAAADALWQTLPEEQRGKVVAVAMDMSGPYAAAAAKHAPKAQIVHDKFHVSKHLNEAVDQVRRQEHKALQAVGDDRLVGSRQLWLFNPKNLSPKRKRELNALKRESLKTGRAWAIKEHFRHFWNYVYPDSALSFFTDWYGWAVRSQLKPIRTKAKMLKRHLPGLLNYFRQPVTNAMTEGFNSKIQYLKAAARGFRNFASYRIRILFYCGRLSLLPDEMSH